MVLCDGGREGSVVEGGRVESASREFYVAEVLSKTSLQEKREREREREREPNIRACFNIIA